MPVNPIWATMLRRHWALVGAIGLFAVFSLANALVFQPVARRYEVAEKQAAELGLTSDPAKSPALMPPRVFALVADNALPSSQAQELGNSGVLTARLLEDLTRLIDAHGMEVMMTEPGAVTQEGRSVIVRAYLKVSGRYDQLVTLFGDVAKDRQLIAIDRFNLSTTAPGRESIDLWVSRLILKQDRSRP